MTIKALGYRVLVKPISLEKKTESGLIISYGEDEKRHEAGVDEGTVVDIGSTCWRSTELGGEPWCKVGDHILFSKYSGRMIKDRNDPTQKYFLINDTDVQAVVVKENE